MRLSRKIFWDVDFNSLDYIEHKKFIIERVLLKGNLSDWEFLKEKYGVEQLKILVPQIRTLDSKTAHFISNLFDLPIEEFKCYSQIQSTQKP